MHPKELTNLALSAASIAESEGFTNTAIALVELATAISHFSDEKLPQVEHERDLAPQQKRGLTFS